MKYAEKSLYIDNLSVGVFDKCLCPAKGTVSGVVKDGESGETMVGVSIYAEQLKTGTTTNEKGYYELSLPFGKHILQVSCIGYDTEIKTIDISNKPLKLNFSLKTDITTLSEVQITGEKKDRNVSEMAMSVQKLDMITIKDSRLVG